MSWDSVKNLLESTVNEFVGLFDPQNGPQSGPQTDSPPVDTQTSGYTPADPQAVADVYGTQTEQAPVYDTQCRLPTIWDLDAGLRAIDAYGQASDAAVAARQNVPAPDVTGEIVVLGDAYAENGRPIFYEECFATPFKIEVLNDPPSSGEYKIPIYVTEAVDPTGATELMARPPQLPGESTNVQVPPPLPTLVPDPTSIPGWGSIYASPGSPSESALLSGLQAAYEASTNFTPVAGADYSTADGYAIADQLLASGNAEVTPKPQFEIYGDRHGWVAAPEESPMCLAARGVTVYYGNLPLETPSQSPASPTSAPAVEQQGSRSSYRPAAPEAVAETYGNGSGLTAAEEAAFDAAFCDPSGVRTSAADPQPVQSQTQETRAESGNGGWLADLNATLREAVEMYNVNRLGAIDAETQARAQVRAEGRAGDPRPASYSSETNAWSDGAPLPQQDAFSEAYAAQRTSIDAQMSIGISDTVAAPQIAAEQAQAGGARPVCVENVPAAFAGLKFDANTWLSMLGEQPMVVSATYGEQSAPIRAAVFDGFMTNVQQYFAEGLPPIFLTGQQNGNGGRLAVFIQGNDVPLWLDHDGSVIEHTEGEKVYRFVRENGSFRVEVADYIPQSSVSEPVAARGRPATQTQSRSSAAPVANNSGPGITEILTIDGTLLPPETGTSPIEEPVRPASRTATSEAAPTAAAQMAYGAGVGGVYAGILHLINEVIEYVAGPEYTPYVAPVADMSVIYGLHTWNMTAGGMCLAESNAMFAEAGPGVAAAANVAGKGSHTILEAVGVDTTSTPGRIAESVGTGAGTGAVAAWMWPYLASTGPLGFGVGTVLYVLSDWQNNARSFTYSVDHALDDTDLEYCDPTRAECITSTGEVAAEAWSNGVHTVLSVPRTDVPVVHEVAEAADRNLQIVANVVSLDVAQGIYAAASGDDWCGFWEDCFYD